MTEGQGARGAPLGMPEGSVALTDVHGLVEAVLDALPSPTMLIDGDGTVLLANSAWITAAEQVDDDRIRAGIGGNYFQMVLGLADDATNQSMISALRELSGGARDTVTWDYALPHRAGVLWFHLQASRVGDAGHVVVTHTDVTSQVLAEKTSAWQARHDHLTTLPNRAHLHELIDAELQRPDHPALAVLFLDVDGFKDINDSLGHDVGDELLRQVAARLAATTRALDTVGRFSGDTFVVLGKDCDAQGAEYLAARCRSAFDQPFELAGRSVQLSACIGIAGAAAREHCVRSADLVRDADLAKYAAKAAGRNQIRVFTVDLRDAVEQKLLVFAELRQAIENGQLVLHYQPVLNLLTGKIDGAEALVRWQHPQHGLLPPAAFIPVAEQSELIGPLTRWVLGAATREAAEWARRGRPLVVGVNVSAAFMAAGTLVDDVAEALAASGLPPDLLVVELTETAVAEDPERAAAQFADLRVSGVEVSIDDFGSGFSSLGQLVNIPAGVLKIDRSLVTGSANRNQSAAAIAAVVALAKACGMRSLAEGVETAEQLALAAELGCRLAQGYHIARPMPADQLSPWLEAHRTARERARRELSGAQLSLAAR